MVNRLLDPTERKGLAGTVELSSLKDQTVAFDGGGLSRKLSIYRLPEADWSACASLDRSIAFSGGADLRVYIRVTQSDGHQAWTSPIYRPRSLAWPNLKQRARRQQRVQNVSSFPPIV